MIVQEEFPSIYTAVTVGLESWVERQRAAGLALGAMFARIDNTDRDRVVLRVGTRADWLRERPKLARQLVTTSDLQVLVIERSAGRSWAFAELLAFSQKREG